MQYPIFAVVGKRGWGKTVLLAKVAKDVTDEDAHLPESKRRKIFANFHLEGIPYTYITFKDILEFPEYLRDGILLIDEAHIGADSYKFFAKGTTAITKFATQTRKAHITFFWTTQVYTQVAKRLRRLTDNIIYTKPHPDKPNYFIIESYEAGDNDAFIDVWEYDAEPYYKYYDTDEIIEND